MLWTTPILSPNKKGALHCAPFSVVSGPLFAASQEFIEAGMHVLGQCPAPIREGMAGKGVVVIEEGHSGYEQGYTEHGRYGGQGA